MNFNELKQRLPVTVTQILPQKNNPDRVSLFEKGEFLLGVFQQTCIECQISVGSQLTVPLLERIETFEGYQSVLAKAYDFLSRRDHASGELRRKLLNKGFAKEVIYEVIDHLTEKGYLNDLLFAEKFALEKSRLNRWGQLKIESELLKKGVAPAILKKGTESALCTVSEDQICLQLILKRKKHFMKETDPVKRKNKIFYYLSGKGFTSVPITKAVQQFELENDV